MVEPNNNNNTDENDHVFHGRRRIQNNDAQHHHHDDQTKTSPTAGQGYNKIESSERHSTKDAKCCSSSSSSVSSDDDDNNNNSAHSESAPPVMLFNMTSPPSSSGISATTSTTIRNCLLHNTRWLHYLRRNGKIVLLGQCLSLLLASAGAAQATLYLDCGLSAPTFTMMLIYGGLSLNIVVLVRRRQYRCRRIQPCSNGEHHHRHHPLRQQESALSNDLALSVASAEEEGDEEEHAGDDNEEVDDDDGCKSTSTIITETADSSHSFCFGWLPLHRSLWWYFFIAFVDVQANAITMLAFRYTTLTSVTLFDALAIPSSMISSKCWLKREYRCMHFAGVLVCMVGVVANIMTDYKSDVDGTETEVEKVEYPHKLRGDLCAITGGILYGFNNVLTEVTVGDADDNVEYLAMMGLFGFLISLVQSLVLEWDDILEFFGESDAHSSTCSLQKGWGLFFTFVGVTMLNYAGASRFLMISEAAFFNLSLLTGDLWSVIFSIVAERIIPRPLFFVAMVIVLSGVVLYEMAPSPATEKDFAHNNNSNESSNVKDGILRESSVSCFSDADHNEDEDDGIEMQ
jgi:solute carrier family 35, member F1/2